MIRHARKNELERVLEIYGIGRQFMRDHGNPDQWNTSYPERATLEDDIEKEQLYVICDENDHPRAVFAFIHGEDPTYGYIEGGSWITDAPYGTIHRIASDGTTRGVLSRAVEYVKKQYDHIRIDTHEKNIPMQGAILKNGFEYRGVIYLEDGDPRWAYEYLEGATNK